MNEDHVARKSHDARENALTWCILMLHVIDLKQTCGDATLSPGQTIATCQRNISQQCWAHVATCCVGMLRSFGRGFTLKTTKKLVGVAVYWDRNSNIREFKQ